MLGNPGTLPLAYGGPLVTGKQVTGSVSVSRKHWGLAGTVHEEVPKGKTLGQTTLSALKKPSAIGSRVVLKTNGKNANAYVGFQAAKFTKESLLNPAFNSNSGKGGTLFRGPFAGVHLGNGEGTTLTVEGGVNADLSKITKAGTAENPLQPYGALQVNRNILRNKVVQFSITGDASYYPLAKNEGDQLQLGAGGKLTFLPKGKLTPFVSAGLNTQGKNLGFGVIWKQK